MIITRWSITVTADPHRTECSAWNINMLNYWISNLLYIRCFFVLKKDKDILRFLCIPKVPLYSWGEDFYKFNAFKLRMNEGNWLSHKRYAYIQPNLTTDRIPFTPMGVLTPGSTHARSSARAPIDMSGNFPAHMSAESPSNISPNPSEVISEVSEP